MKTSWDLYIAWLPFKTLFIFIQGFFDVEKTYPAFFVEVTFGIHPHPRDVVTSWSPAHIKISKIIKIDDHLDKLFSSCFDSAETIAQQFEPWSWRICKNPYSQERSISHKPNESSSDERSKRVHWRGGLPKHSWISLKCDTNSSEQHPDVVLEDKIRWISTTTRVPVDGTKNHLRESSCFDGRFFPEELGEIPFLKLTAKAPWKLMVGRGSCPFGFRPIFRGYISARKCRSAE